MQVIPPESGSAGADETRTQGPIWGNAQPREWRSISIRVEARSPIDHEDLAMEQRQAIAEDVPCFSWYHPDDRFQCVASGELLIWHDQEYPHEGGSVSGPTPRCFEEPMSPGQLTVFGHRKHLFTLLRTNLPEDALEYPWGYCAFPFSQQPSFDVEGIWRGWPGSVIRIPQTLLVWDRHSDAGERIQLNVPGLKTCTTVPRGVSSPHVAEEKYRSESHETQALWAQRVLDATSACGQQRLQKVVLARSMERWSESGRPYDAAGTYQRLLSSYPSHANYALHMQRRTFLGSSPETLVKICDRRLDTHALAGTVPIDRQGQIQGVIDPMTDPKLLIEHAIVVEDLVARLSPWVNNLEVSARPRIKYLRRMAHLETPISGDCSPELSVLDMVPKIHPTPALGGLPRETAQAWLAQNERLERGYYGGVLGWFDARGDGHCAVAIRCGLISDQRAVAFAGAGIVVGSEPEPEWDETELKMVPFFTHLVDLQETSSP